jgi:hypothetical protein
LPNRRAGQHFLALGQRPVVAEQQRRDGHALRRREQCRIRLRLVRQRAAKVAIETQHVARLIERIEHHAAEHLRHHVEPKLDRRDDAEVSAAAAERPKELLVRHGARAVELPVGGHDLGADQIVDREPVLAHEPTQTAAEGETGDPGVRNRAACGCETVRLSLPIELTPQRAALRRNSSRRGVDTNAFQ